jgi:hypothetical protein
MLPVLPLLDSPMDPATKWIVAASAVIVILLTVFRPMFRKKDPLDAAPSKKTLAQQRSVERQMETLVVELEKMARQITAQLDTRAGKLELLIKEADEKIAGLARAAASGPTPGQSNPTIGATTPPTSTLLSEHDARHNDVYSLADQGRAPHEIAHILDRPSGEVELILALRKRA